LSEVSTADKSAFNKGKGVGTVNNQNLDEYLDLQIEQIRETVGDEQVLLGLSGGVDSTVCAGIISKAIPGQLYCIFVDHGLMRLNEGDQIEAVFSDKVKLIRVDAKNRFLSRLKGVSDPETKRKIIGEEFLRVFEEEATKLGDVKYFAQGTIYPDIVESGATGKANIKSHHNVGGLPEKLNFKGIIEPLSGLYKEGVRTIGRKLDLPDFLIDRQPFPGPGLAVRVMGEITEQKLDTLRLADAIVRDEIDKLEQRPSQYFAVMTDTYSVGVKDEKRTYDPVVAVRAVVTDDFMTGAYAALPHDVLGRIAKRITEEVAGVSRVVYDVTSKPPGTVEWE